MKLCAPYNTDPWHTAVMHNARMRELRMRPPLARTAALAVTLILVAAAPAAARVSISATRIIVSSSGARAVITRAPLRIAIGPCGGRPALSEFPNRQPRPQALTPTADPIAPGLDNPSTHTLYTPLSFTVGGEQFQQYEGGIWGGNPKTGSLSGIRYSARGVLSVSRWGAGVRLIVSTNDPRGRRLIVTVVPAGTGAIRISAAANPARGVVQVADAFSSGSDEAFFGFGGRHNGLNQRGQVLSSFVEEENLVGIGGSRTLYPNGPTAAYYPQAEFFSSRPYGFLLAQPQLARFKLDSDRQDAWSVAVSGSTLDYVVAPGSAPRAIGTLTALSGRQPLPPRWALGPMLDRLVKNFGETEQDYEASVTADLANLVRYGLPITAYRIEGWGLPPAGNDGLALHSFISFARQRQVIATLRRRRIHPLVYFRPWITPGSAPSRQGLVARQANGAPYDTTSTTGAKIELLDFTNPAAVRFWKREVDKALDLGADGFMQDFGEEVLYGMHFADGETGVTMHNRYLMLYARATREDMAQYERRNRGRQLWFFTRAGYTGLPGSTAFEGGNFPGDETTSWDHQAGLASLTSDMLGRAVDGAYGYATDIGGYYDLTTPPTTKELFLRWAEWATLSPVFRLHGSGRAGTHTPWSYDAQTVRIYDRLSRLHLAAVPLILRLWHQASETGIPVVRPLWLQYPADRAARRQDQEWLLGSDVLVAPVVVQGASARAVYFPAGCWRSPQSGRKYEGRRIVRVGAPLDQLPYFFRCGRHPF